MRVRVLGDLTLIPSDLRAIMAKIMKETAAYTDGPVLNICFAYAARRDMALAVQRVAQMVKQEGVQVEDIDETVVGACLTSGFARGSINGEATQLLVRTSGETRLSDFLLWEAEDAVLCFYPVLWPDLSAWDFVRILLEYERQREGRNEWRRRRGVDEKGFKTGSEVSAAMRTALEEERKRYFKEIEDYCEVETRE